MIVSRNYIPFGQLYRTDPKSAEVLMKGFKLDEVPSNNYSFTEYNNGRKDKLVMDKQGLFLTLDENIYTVCKEDGEIVESRSIVQNERDFDIEDRILVGLELLNKYMNIFDQDSWDNIKNRLEWT